MIIFTLIFLLFALRYLCKGRLLNDWLREISEVAFKLKEAEEEEKYKAGVKAFTIYVFACASTITKLVYLAYAYDIDAYKLPTLIMILLHILTIFQAFLNREKESRNKLIVLAYQKRSARGIFGNLISAAYYSYILYLLVF